MTSRVLALVLTVLATAPMAAAQDAGSSAPRFQVTPEGNGVVRLDTQSGAVSHCAPRGNIWYCDPPADAAGNISPATATPAGATAATGTADRTPPPADVAAELANVSHAVDELTARVDDLAARLERATAPSAVTAQPQAAPRPAAAAGQVSPASQVVGRFLALVHRLKHGADQRS
jgi:hypothetical protein